MSVGTPTAIGDYESTGTSNTHAEAVDNDCNIGDFIVVTANISNVTNAMTLADDKGNTWTAIVSAGPVRTGGAAGNTGSVQAWYSVITTKIVGGVDKITLGSTPSAVRANWIARKYTGVDTSSPIRTAGAGTNEGGTASTAWTAPSAAGLAGDMMVADGVIGGAAVTLGSLTSGFTQYLKVADTRALASLYKLFSSSTTQAVAGTLSAPNPWVGVSYVLKSATVANTAPTANAGTDQTGIEPFATVTANGTGSSDPDVGDTLTYAWTQSSGPTVTLSSSTAASPTFTAPAVKGGATVVLSLVVTDNHGSASSADTVSFTILGHTLFQCRTAGLVPLKITRT